MAITSRLTNDEIAEVETLVKEETAFTTYGAMVKSMQNGYVPSIYSNKMFNPTRQWATVTIRSYKQRVRLTQLLRKDGYQVFDGCKTS